MFTVFRVAAHYRAGQEGLSLVFLRLLAQAPTKSTRIWTWGRPSQPPSSRFSQKRKRAQ